MRVLEHFWTGSCHATAGLLSAQLEDEVPLTQRGRVRRHLARCAACQAVLRSLERLVGELRTLRRADDSRFPSVSDAVIARVRRDEFGAPR